MRRPSIDDAIQATLSYRGRGFYASLHAIQERSEIRELAQMVQELEPRVIVEIGTCKGGTLYLWCRTNPTLEAIATIDLPGVRWGAPYGQRRPKMYREFLRDNPAARMICLQKDSHSAATAVELKRELAGRPVDFLFIDGDHRYEGVKRDFELYSPMVRQGGIIALHDIITRRDEHEVYRLWAEIKGSYRHRELIANPDGWMGIGVLFQN